MKFDIDFVDKFDDLAFFLLLWKRFRNPSWKETRNNMTECTDTYFTYTSHDSDFASRLFAFYNPICNLEYLANHLGDLRPSGKTYIEYIIRICQSQREDISKDVEKICDVLNVDLNTARYLERFVPCSEHSFNIFLKRCPQNISLIDFIQQVSFIFIVDVNEYVTNHEEFKTRFDAFLNFLKTPKRYPYSLEEVEYRLRKQLGEWFKKLNLDYAKDLMPTSKPLVDGLFAITWTYVTFIRGTVLVYHPLHPNDKPFKIEDGKSISALNNIKGHYAARLPRLIVKAENGYIVNVYNYTDIDSGIVFLLEKYNKENQTIVSKTKRSPSDFDNKELREYIHQLKSTYLDWLCCQQIPDFKIYYIREVRTNNNLIDEDEDAFLFVIKASASSLIAIYENAKEARSSILFKIPKGQLDVKVQEIHEFFSSNAVNKRDQIARGIVKDKLFQQGKYERVLHTNFSQWQTKVLHFN